ncbi:MAG TPA: lactate racemase domain-containing protein [Urbifossiella sp.]|nr:lactate racemase domain-containing protein [Urbifossiella sp.]
MDLPVGRGIWTIDVPPGKLVPVRPAAVPSVPTAAPRELVRAALEAPFGFEPLRRALTPDDRVVVVFDPALPAAAELLAGVLDHLRTARIEPAAVTVVTPPGSPAGWIDDLPDEYADLTAETHDPADDRKRAYLATTGSGRRVYLNRTLVEADATVILTGRGYDPVTGYGGAEAAVFPGLAAAEPGPPAELDAKAPDPAPTGLRAEAVEVAWLLGSPFLVQVIEGAGDAVQEIVAGLLGSSAEGVRRQDARWRGTVPARVPAVVAAVSGSPERVTFLDLAKAAACAARVVEKGGRVAVLSDAAPALGEGAALLRALDGPEGASKRLAKLNPPDRAACVLWAWAARRAGLFLASGLPDDVAEELFATALRTPAEVARLTAAADAVIVIPDAHKAMVTVEGV